MSVPAASSGAVDSFDTTISQLAHRSLQSFHTALALSFQEDARDVDAQVQDNLARYRIWASNLGAWQVDQRSADYRLRRAPEVRDHIIQLLTALTSCNNDIWDIASGARQDGSSLAHELEDYDDDLFLDHQPQSEALELALNVADVVTNLMKVSALIRKATTRDRYARAYSENEIPFLTEFDARHVADKFPKTVAHSWLLDRLGKANARRRLYLRYARDHRDRLGESAKIVDENTGTVRDSNAPQATVASTLQVQNIRLEDLDRMSIDESNPSDTTSAASSVDAGSFSRGLHVIRHETLSKEFEPFECPYCLGIVRFKSKSAWKKHVFHDLRAYVCTSQHCTTAMFGSRREWSYHEQEAHRREWTCVSCSGQKWATSEGLKRHLVKVHNDGRQTQELLDLVMQAGSRPVLAISLASCPLCDESKAIVPTQRFQRHVARHLEQLALFAVSPLYTVENEAISDRQPAHSGAVESQNEGTESSDGEDVLSEGSLELTLREHMDALTTQEDTLHSGLAGDTDSSGSEQESTGLARQWFVPAEGIDRQVITADIHRYLGRDATVRPGLGIGEMEGVQGYWIKAYRNLTNAMIADLRGDSARWRHEQDSGNRVQPGEKLTDHESSTSTTTKRAQPPPRGSAPEDEDSLFGSIVDLQAEDDNATKERRASAPVVAGTVSTPSNVPEMIAAEEAADAEERAADAENEKNKIMFSIKGRISQAASEKLVLTDPYTRSQMDLDAAASGGIGMSSNTPLPSANVQHRQPRDQADSPGRPSIPPAGDRSGSSPFDQPWEKVPGEPGHFEIRPAALSESISTDIRNEPSRKPPPKKPLPQRPTTQGFWTCCQCHQTNNPRLHVISCVLPCGHRKCLNCYVHTK